MFGRCDKAGSNGILSDIGRLFLQVGVIPHPVIKIVPLPFDVLVLGQIVFPRADYLLHRFDLWE